MGLGVGKIKVAVSVATLAMALGLPTACAGSKPTPEMTRAARLALGDSVADGTKRLGECLKASGYDTDLEKVADQVKRGKDIALSGKAQATYAGVVKGPTTSISPLPMALAPSFRAALRFSGE
jgi:hypothetical protein